MHGGRLGSAEGRHITFRLPLGANYYFNRRTPAGFLKAVECFERAVAEDPGMAPAWAALSWCYGNATVTSTLTPSEAREKAMAAARTALSLDPALAEAHVSLGAICALHSFDWKQAESHFLRALRLEEAEGHQALASQLDPLSAVVANATGMLRLMQRQYEGAEDAFRAALRIDPQYPWAHRGIGELLLLRGRYAEALQSLARVEMPALAEGLTGYAQARLGREFEARERLRRLELSGHASVAYQIAILHLGLNEVEATFRWLERACNERSIGVIWLPVEPIWDAVRDDARFPRLVAAMGCS
jgi:tetratricopeptide (TPR) repeat protein